MSPDRRHRPHPDADGYWLLEPDGWNYAFANPPARPRGTAEAIVGGGRQPGEQRPGSWQLLQSLRTVRGVVRPVRHLGVGQAGVPIPSYPFTGSIFDWAAANTGVLPSTGRPVPGDAVLYGTGLPPRRPPSTWAW